jgi:peptidoglycan hydrolase-like amidase
MRARLLTITAVATVALSLCFGAAAQIELGPGGETAASVTYPGSLSGGAIFVIRGHGWGHGIGLSQYGAFGYARRGFTYDRILAHYYPGTQLGPAPVAKGSA